MPKQLLAMIGGLALAAILVVAGLIAFLLPPDVLAPTAEERAAEQAEAEAEAEAEQEDEGASNRGEADDPLEGTPGTDEPDDEAAEEAPGGGDGAAPGDAAGGTEPGGEDTGEVADEALEDEA